MGRPKKNGENQPSDLKEGKLYEEEEAAAENGENQPQNENNEQFQEGKEAETFLTPIEIEHGADIPLLDVEDNCYIITFPQDIELYDGRMMLITGIYIRDGYVGFISPTEDNAQNGLKIENGIRLTNSDVICMKAGKKVKLVLNINDDVFTQEQTNFGTRPRRLKIPAHTPVAKLVLFKQ